MTCFIETAVQPFRLAYPGGNFDSAAGYPSVLPMRGKKSTEWPVDDDNAALYQGCVPVGDNFAEIFFFGVPAEGEGNDVVTFRIHRVMRVQTIQQERPQWISVPVIAGTADLGGPSGVAETPVLATQTYADEITVVSDYDDGHEEPTNQPDGMIASLRIDPKGAGFLQIIFDLSGGTAATSANALVKTY